MKHRILVIDDEAAVRDSLRMILEYDVYDCLLAPSGQDGVTHLERESPDLVLLDVKMPGMDGLDVLRRIREMDELVPVVMISGHGTVPTAVEATKLGAFDFLEKPLSTERVKVAIRNALDQRSSRTRIAVGGGPPKCGTRCWGAARPLPRSPKRSAWPRRSGAPSSSRARAASARSWWHARSIATAHGPGSGSSRSTARRFPTT